MTRLNHWCAAVAAILLAGAGVTIGAAPAYAAPCADVNVVFARGTFEPPGLGGVGDAFVDSLRAKSGKSVDVYGVNYPASLDFGAAADGVADASAKVRDIAATCPNSKIVIGGYSQGAAVAVYLTEDTLPQGFALPPQIQGPMPAEIANHVAAVALFGKPTSGFMQMIYSGAPPITVGPRYTGKTVEEPHPGRSHLLADGQRQRSPRPVRGQWSDGSGRRLRGGQAGRRWKQKRRPDFGARLRRNRPT